MTYLALFGLILRHVGGFVKLSLGL